MRPTPLIAAVVTGVDRARSAEPGTTGPNRQGAERAKTRLGHAVGGLRCVATRAEEVRRRSRPRHDHHYCYYADERGTEGCSRSEDGGYFHDFCFGDRICLQPAEGLGLGGGCVDREFCRWARTRSEPEYAVPCLYSDGTEFVDGPPDEECGVGADPTLPFCGGRCGDTCPPNVSHHPTPGCHGISETRAFGVCAPDPNPPCSELNVLEALGSCNLELSQLRGGDHTARCVCMRLTREPGGAFPHEGVGVAVQSCLAYRERYPDQVSCLGYEWLEEP